TTLSTLCLYQAKRLTIIRYLLVTLFRIIILF
ncbi:uncharacterized protein METZ01_LOCUS384639, partial [marine metagenome]